MIFYIIRPTTLFWTSGYAGNSGYRYWRWHRDIRVMVFSLFSPLKSINANYLINEASYQNIFMSEHSWDQKSALCQTVSRPVLNGWEKAEQTDKQTRNIFGLQDHHEEPQYMCLKQEIKGNSTGNSGHILVICKLTLIISIGI